MEGKTLVIKGREDLGGQSEDLGDGRKDLGDQREDLGDSLVPKCKIRLSKAK